MSQTPEQLLATLRARPRVGAFVFPMHEPDGYPPANDMVLDAARDSGGLLTPFCRVKPGDDAIAEAERALAAGAKGIKLHPRAEQFTLDHPDVRKLAALADERGLPMLIHAGRGIPALGSHAVQLAGEYPNARLILAHAAICDLSWIWRVAPDYPNLLFDTAWWMPADLQALFSLVPPGRSCSPVTRHTASRWARLCSSCGWRCRRASATSRSAASPRASHCGSPPASRSCRAARRSESASRPHTCCWTACPSS